MLLSRRQQTLRAVNMALHGQTRGTEEANKESCPLPLASTYRAGCATSQQSKSVITQCFCPAKFLHAVVKMFDLGS